MDLPLPYKEASFVALFLFVNFKSFTMKKINLGFSRYADAVLLVVAQTILAALTGNLYFPTPTPTLAVLQAAVDDYAAALSAAKDRGKNNVAAKNTRRKELIALLQQLGRYCMLTAGTNIDALISSGFELSKTRQPMPPIEAPSITKMDNGVNSGDLLIAVDRPKGAKGYIFEYTLDAITDSSVWTSITTTTSKATIAGLEPGKKYWFRVTIIGAKGQAVTCEPVLSKVVQ